MILTSPAFAANGHIPSQYTCDGENVSPPLVISDVPVGTKSLILIVDDPDAPQGTWVHWLVWNIDPNIRTIMENSIPDEGLEGVTSFGKPGWGGPCPPSNVHRYFFKLMALNILLVNFDSNSTVTEIFDAAQGHILATAELIGLYQRQ